MSILSLIVFLLLGAVIGFVGSLIFDQNNKIISPLLGAVGSVGLAWIAGLLKLGAGLAAFSLWGFIAAIVGGCLLTVIYGLVSKKLSM